MKKAKSKARQSQTRRNGLNSVNMLHFRVDNRQSVMKLSKGDRTRAELLEAAIQIFCKAHNGMYATTEMLTQHEKSLINAACLLMEQVIDTRIVSFNQFLDEKFEKLEQLNAKTRRKKVKTRRKSRKKTSKKTARRK